MLVIRHSHTYKHVPNEVDALPGAVPEDIGQGAAATVEVNRRREVPKDFFRECFMKGYLRTLPQKQRIWCMIHENNFYFMDFGGRDPSLSFSNSRPSPTGGTSPGHSVALFY